MQLKLVNLTFLFLFDKYQNSFHKRSRQVLSSRLQVVFNSSTFKFNVQYPITYILKIVFVGFFFFASIINLWIPNDFHWNIKYSLLLFIVGWLPNLFVFPLEVYEFDSYWNRFEYDVVGNAHYKILLFHFSNK